MTEKSILLSIDGSSESLYASEAACYLARALPARLTAQTVADSNSVWEAIGPGMPGLIGSGPYMAARESIMSGLRAIGEVLLQSFEARASGHGLEIESVVDEGNRAYEIAERAKNHDLLVIGHRRQPRLRQQKDECAYVRPSICKEVLERLSCPALIVQGRLAPPATARLIASAETYSPALLHQFLMISGALKTKRQIYFIGDEEATYNLIARAKEEIVGQLKVEFMNRPCDEVDGDWECAIDSKTNMLLVISTCQVGDERRTCAKTPLAEFVDQFGTNAAVIMPPLAPAKKTMAVKAKARQRK